jgi:hypothetical protein
MIKTSKDIYSYTSCLLILIVISYFVFFEPPENIFNFDLLGYYLYLPATFKYDNISLTNIQDVLKVISQYGSTDGFYQAFKVDGSENWVIKYPIGLSILFLPFYFIGELIASCTNYPTDGFSKPYQLSVLYGSYVYTLVGLYYFRKILRDFFTDKITSIVLLIFYFGTNLLLYSSMYGQPANVHNIILTLHTLVIYQTIKWHKYYKFNILISIGVLIGIIAITRPPEALIILFPLLYTVYDKQTFKNKIQLFIKHKSQLIITSILFSLVILIQLIYWKHVTRKFIFDSYQNNLSEGFNFSSPYILEFLFSFRKGWLLYSPIIIFSIIGFYFLYKIHKSIFYSIFIFFILNLYVISSWSCWWYGMSFSSRAIVSSYVILAIPMGYFLIEVGKKNKLKYIITSVIIILIGFNLFQIYQYRNGIIHPTLTSKEYYKSVFLQITPPTEDQSKLLLMDKWKMNDITLNETPPDLSSYKLVYKKTETFDSLKKKKGYHFTKKISFTKPYCCVTNKDFKLSDKIEKVYKEITKKSYLIFKVKAKVLSTYKSEMLDAKLLINMQHKNKWSNVKTFQLNTLNLKQNQWNDVCFYYITPDFWCRKDFIQCYLWNFNDKTIFIDNLELEAYEPIEDESVF